jgi:hypothetical protein
VEPFGISLSFLVRLLFSLALPLAWLLLSLLALFTLRGRGLAGTTLALWVLITVALPFLGALPVWIVRPGDQPPAVRT